MMWETRGTGRSLALAGIVAWCLCVLAAPLGVAAAAAGGQDAEIARDIAACRAAIMRGAGSETYIRSVADGRFGGWQEAADSGDLDAVWLIAWCHRHGVVVEKNVDQSVALLQLAADKGHAMSQHSLGSMYANGPEGVPKYDHKAVQLYQEAVKQGYAPAQFGLGWMYEHGRGGLPKDDVKAVELYRLAADQGHAGGQNNLGLMYDEGRGGLRKDEVKAVELYRLAVEGGGAATAQFNLARAYLDLELRRPWGGKEGRNAVELLQLAAAQGYAPAQFTLGWMHGEGLGDLPKDEHKAVELYRLAAEQGHPPAQFRLGICYATGHGVPRDMQKAKRWFALAADQGYVAQAHDVPYNGGHGIEANRDKAIYWYRLIAEDGNAGAMLILGAAHENGDGAPHDLVAAHLWYSLALEAGSLEAAEARERVARSMKPEQVTEAKRQAREWQERSQGHRAKANEEGTQDPRE